jgi:hypothetical protein
MFPGLTRYYSMFMSGLYVLLPTGTEFLAIWVNDRADMKQPTVKKIKGLKAVFGVITAVFSLAIAIQQVIQLKKGKTSQA